LISNDLGDIHDKGGYVQNGDIIPDGILKISESNEKAFKYKLSVNDNLFF
jgi:hypothetical protein